MLVLLNLWNNEELENLTIKLLPNNIEEIFTHPTKLESFSAPDLSCCKSDKISKNIIKYSFAFINRNEILFNLIS